MSILKYALLFFVSLAFTLFTWLGGGIVIQWLSPWSMWLTLLILEILLLLPEQRSTESLFDARKRVWKALLHDPLLWLSLSLILFLVLQWLNAATFAEWDPMARVWKIVSPAYEWLRSPFPAKPPANPTATAYQFIAAPFKWLPSSLRSCESWEVLNWFPLILTSLLAVKHGLLKRSKRYLIYYICLMTIVLSIAGIVQYLMQGTFLYWGMKTGAFFFATFGYPNHAAAYFPAMMALSAGVLFWVIENKHLTRLPVFIFAITFVLSATSGILSESRAGVLFTLFIGLFTILFVIIRYFGSWDRKFRWTIPLLLGIFLVVVGGTIAFRLYAMNANFARAKAARVAKTEAERAQVLWMPQYASMPAIDPILSEIAQTDWATFFEHPILGRSGYQGILALRMHAAHPWVGTGARSFRWLNINYIDQSNPDEQKWINSRKGVGQANVHNDTLQFLAEHGWIGFGLMVACALSLFVPFLIAFIKSPSAITNDAQADRCWMNRLNPIGVFALLATSIMFLHSFIDLIYRSPACMMLYGVMFVTLSGFILTTKGKHHA